MTQLAMQPELSNSKKSLFLRISAWAGVVGPVLFVLVFTLDGFLQPDYSSLSQMISWLALRPYGWIQDSNFVVFGLLLIIFTIGFFQRMRSLISRKWLRVGTLLLLISGAGWANDGFFISDMPGTSTFTFHGVMHDIGFLVIFSLLIAAFFVIGRQLLKNPVWGSYGWYSIIAAVVTLGLFFPLLVIANRVPQLTGVFNRLLIVEAIAWYVVMGWRFLRMPSAEAKDRV